MLEEKVEALTGEIVALRKTLEKALPGLTSGASGGGDTEDKPAAKKAAPKKAAPKKAAVEPTHDADEVAAIMRRAAKEVDKAAVQTYIAEQECADLAELLTKPELFDAAYEFAQGQLGEEDGDGDEDI